MRHYKSEYTFEKYKPYESRWKRFCRSRKKKKNSAFPVQRENSRYGKNPFKSHRKKISLTTVKVLILIVLILGWVVLLFYLPFFRINKITISGLNNLTNSEIEQLIYTDYFKPSKLIPYNDYFLVNPDKIKDGINKKYALQSVQVTKTFPNQLNIDIVEKISALIYDNGQKYYLLDSGGTVIKYLTDVDSGEFISKPSASSTGTPKLSATTTATIGMIASESTASSTTSTLEHVPDYKKIQKLFGDYPIVYDSRGLQVDVKQIGVLPEQFISSVDSWFKGLAGQGIVTKYFLLSNMNSGLTIFTTNPWNILFKYEDSPDAEINSLKNILKNIHPVNYVDLRFGDRVYWK